MGSMVLQIKNACIFNQQASIYEKRNLKYRRFLHFFFFFGWGGGGRHITYPYIVLEVQMFEKSTMLWDVQAVLAALSFSK